MNAINYAISIINRKIPKEVLRIAFLSNLSHQTTIPITTDARIKQLVINDRVLDDINIVGGTTVTIPLNGLRQDIIDNNAAVINIPKTRTQGRSILTVHSVAFGASAIDGYTTNLLIPTGDFANSQQQLLNSIASLPYTSEGMVSLIAENTIMVKGINALWGNLYLKCEVENDSNLNNIKRRSYLAFSKLCVLAVKAYIYNNCIVPMDIAYIEGGANLGKIRDIIESYDTAEDDYTEYLETTWAKVSKLNDPITVEHLVRISAGGSY